MARKDLFRKKSLDTVSSPEKLDEYLKVTSPGIWAALAACLAIVVAAVVWMAVGRIPETLELQGILFPGDGTIAAVAAAEGRIQDMRVSAGDVVQPQDIIAVVAQPELAAELEALLSADNPDEETIRAKRQEYLDASVIRAQDSGIVLDVKHTNDQVAANEAVATMARITQATNQYEILCYVPTDTARRLAVGMEVQACPTYVSREEYGYMSGYIAEIGDYPVSDSDIEAAVGNRDYVAEVLPEGSCVEVRVVISLDSEADVATVGNSALWSSQRGSTLALNTGDTMNLQVVLDEHQPYELVLNG